MRRPRLPARRRRAAVALAALLTAAGGLAAVTTAEFPDADSVVIEEIERVTIATNGTYRSESECWTKILTEKGRRNERVIEFDYNARYGKAELVYVGAIDAGGVERAIDVSATTQESTDNSSMSSNIYDPLDRHVTCTVPGLCKDETLHVKTVRTQFKSRVEGNWSDAAVLEWSHPILKSVYEVRAPKELPIRRKALRHPLGNVTATERTLEDGSVVHTYVATNSPQMFAEPDMPPQWTAVQNVRLSTVPDWPTLSRWYWDLCAPHLAKTNAAMVAKVEELTAGRVSPSDRMRAVFKFVSQEVRYMGLTLEDKSPGYAPHDVDVTFGNRYGVCRDKAGLLVAMLRLAGFEAYPVLINVGEKMDEEVPQPFFNHAIVAVDEGGRNYTLMDPTNENTKDLFPSYLCNLSYLVARPDGEGLRTSPVPPPAENSIRVTTKAWLDKDGAVALENDIRFFGIGDTAFRGGLARRTPEDRTAFFADRIRGSAPGAELVKCEIEPQDMSDTDVPIRVKLVSKIPEVLLAGETVDELGVPMVSKTFDLPAVLLRGDMALEERKYPLVLPTTAEVDETVELDLGGHLGEPVSLPPAENMAGGLAFRRTYAVSNGVLRAARTYTLAKVEFSPEEYVALRERMKEVEVASRKRPRFAHNLLADVNVRCRLWQYDATTRSPYSWTATSVVENAAITYQGKKDIAELKIGYNPAVESAELVSATVSNRDGRVYSVSTNEINVMDCGWASEAPRYPAGKIIVASLPSVEIGSVVRIEVVKTVTNAPAPYRFEKYFDDYGRVDRIKMRVDDWSREETNVRRLPTDANQIDGRLWRDYAAVVKGSWAEVAERLRPAAKVKPYDPRRIGLEPDIGEIRKSMVRCVRRVGPSLYELPLDRQITDTQTVLDEGYATRLDYIRTLCALLKGAGYRADIVFAADNDGLSDEVRELDRTTYPRFDKFNAPLCRVRTREGGFLWFGGRTRTVFIGTENEYTPLGATPWDGCEFLDPADGSFGVVTLPEENLASMTSNSVTCLVRETGETDLAFEGWTWGPAVGKLRESHYVLLPEKRKRFFQNILGGISQAASATSEYEIDYEGYPGVTRYSCYIPRYAEVTGDTITFRLPTPLGPSSVPDTHERIRRVGIEAGKRSRDVHEFVVRFPEGYTEVEHLPEDMTLRSPLDAREVWETLRTEPRIGEDGCLEVRIVHEILPRKAPAALPATCGKLFDEWQRRLASRGSSTLMVRKVK